MIVFLQYLLASYDTIRYDRRVGVCDEEDRDGRAMVTRDEERVLPEVIPQFTTFKFNRPFYDVRLDCISVKSSFRRVLCRLISYFHENMQKRGGNQDL